MIFQIQRKLFALSEQMGRLKNDGFIGNVTGAGAGEMAKKTGSLCIFPGCFEKCFYKFSLNCFQWKLNFTFIHAFPCCANNWISTTLAGNENKTDLL